MRKNPISNIGEIELVAIVGGIGERRALQLLHDMGGFDGLLRAGTGEIAASVGEAAAVRIVSALELGRKALERASRAEGYSFPEAEAVYAWAKPRLVPLDFEELWLLALDGRNVLRSACRIASGGLHGLHVSVRDPLRIALREAASAFILVHNHPSGDPTPSPEDIDFTRRVRRAGEEVGAPLVDHVVVARDGYKSMHELGLLRARAS